MAACEKCWGDAYIRPRGGLSSLGARVRTVRMHLEMDMDRYLRLPPDVRVRFNGWLDAESLLEQRCIRLRLGEGCVIIDYFQRADDGQLVTDDAGEPVVVRTIVPISCLPPPEAFT